MHINELKVGMKVKRISNFCNYYFTSTEGNISTVREIDLRDGGFQTYEDIGRWDEVYFEAVEQHKEKAMIDMQKQYKTADGRKVRILCTDVNTEYPVVGVIKSYNDIDVVMTYTADGRQFKGRPSPDDLVELQPLEEFKKDDKVMVSDSGTSWIKRYFSHAEGGKAMCFMDGRNSWTSAEFDNDYMGWNFCRFPTAEELGE